VPLDRPSGLRPLGVVRGKDGGYVQGIVHHRMLQLATTHNLLVEVDARPGDFLLTGDSLVTLWAYGDRADVGDEDSAEEEENGDLIDRFQDLVEIGLERTLERDALYGLQQMTDIALRALSPGVNDPTTAVMCIDRMGELLVALRPITGVEGVRLDDDAVLRIIQPQVRWEECVQTAFVQVRHYGADDPVVAAHVLRTIGVVLDHVPAEARPPLTTVAENMAQVALGASEVESDRQMIREALARSTR
jgi:uncharacterized membrane protein